MTEVEACITAARRYCIDNFDYWSERYSNEISETPYSDNDYNLFPRYNALKAILHEIERLTGQNYPSLETCKSDLIKTGLSNQSIFISGRLNQIEANAILEEKNKFITFIKNLGVEELKNVKSLPFKRRISEVESLLKRKKIESSWGFDGGYWEPIYNKSPDETVFVMRDLLLESDNKEIVDFIATIAKKRIFEITEEKLDYELEVSLLDPHCYETIYFDNSMKWVVYGSHEFTTTFGGTELVAFIKQLFSTRSDLLNKWEY